ncbi:putative alanine racemase-domain-containing protein [Gilbertella persicaria]|uniref:putative alanine racemase-domain-containing protein n=1 Tax=Gilbertella persicaria TaxID=101096 RepID=UPI002220E040|nr:putative alanine racemase-domain-containing protein [Gilbertella persicaria]KAI8069857.1 putative alanine racemase-domain-containing protein [Gilbertella persicaria]
MIQDTGLGQEMFISAYQKLDSNGDLRLHCYRYTDEPLDEEINEQQAMQNEHLSERTLVYCVSPPGENHWAKEAHNAHAGSLSDQINRLDIKEPNQTIMKKYPLPGQDHVSAVVKFYNDSAETIKVGQLVEIIGIRAYDFQPQESDFDSPLDSFSNVPVIHAIGFQRLDAIDSSPFAESSALEQAHDIRAQLINYIASVLGGDRLTAEFILLQLLSRITVKNRGLKIGNFTLNISGCPSHQTTEQEKKAPVLTLNNPLSKSLAHVLDSLTVHSVHLPLTIDGLNKSQFMPKSVNENLEAGVLQLVDGTCLLVDETVLDEGQLVDSGVRNFQALQNVIQHQTLAYEFPYSQYDFDTDISVLVLSCSKSMFPNHCSIRLQSTGSMDVETNVPSKETLDRFRRYVHSAKFNTYDISDQVSEYIQISFVNERKTAIENGTEPPTQEELMLRMNLARLAAASFGETCLTQQRYDYVVQLDKSRKARLSAA